MKAFGITDRGAVRKENQDCFKIYAPEDSSLLCAVLCDGMGGAQAGSVASTIAADAFMFHAANSIDESSTAADIRSILIDAVNYANIKVYDKSFSDFTCMGMGSTLVAVISNGKKTFVANIGDSRAYMIYRGKAEQITKDHSYVEELVARGEISADEAKNHPKKNIITRAVGVEASVKCDVFEIKPPAGARILLCSDGISNTVTDEELASVLDKHREAEMAAKVLLALAMSRGASDNVTVVIAQR